MSMANVLVAYDTKYGQTEKIAEYISAIARLRGFDAHSVRVREIGALEGIDGVVVLSPVFMGKHMDTVREFILRHRDELAARTTMFVSVSGSAGSTLASERSNALHAAYDFVRDVGWKPGAVASIAGALNYPKLNPILRFIVRMIAKQKGEPVNTKGIQEMTDWHEVERITLQLLASLSPPRKEAA